MIPYLLAALGGYLIGNSLSTSSNQYAKGGKTDSQDILDISKLKRFEVTYVPNYDVTKMMQLKRKLIIALDENDVKKQLGSKAKVLKIQEKYSDGGIMDDDVEFRDMYKKFGVMPSYEHKWVDELKLDDGEIWVKWRFKEKNPTYFLQFDMDDYKDNTSAYKVFDALKELDVLQSIVLDEKYGDIVLEMKMGHTWGTERKKIIDLISSALGTNVISYYAKYGDKYPIDYEQQFSRYLALRNVRKQAV